MAMSSTYSKDVRCGTKERSISHTKTYIPIHSRCGSYCLLHSRLLVTSDGCHCLQSSDPSQTKRQRYA